MKEGQPRKVPKGRRGREIVEAIQQATQSLLAAGQHVDDISTNQIAKVAGISVGSFYQYYPNKRAVVADLFRELERKTMELAEQRLAAIQQDDVVSLVTTLVNVLLDISLGPSAARRQIRLHVPPVWTIETSSEVDKAVFAYVVQFLSNNQHALRDGIDPRRAAFILLRSAEAVVEAMFSEAPDFLDRESMSRELCELSLRYLGVAPPHEVPAALQSPGAARHDSSA